MSKKPICNMDCFNCIHPDCINDIMISAELEQQCLNHKEEIDEMLKTPPKEKKERVVKTKILVERDSYYQQHKEERAAYYQKNRADRLAYQKIYDQEHRKQKAANNRAYRKRQAIKRAMKSEKELKECVK